MAENQILPFAQGQGANVLSQADYAGDSMRLQGHQPGVARSALENKALLQCSSIAAGLAQFIADGQADDVTDAKTPAEIAAMLVASVNGSILATTGGTANGSVKVGDKIRMQWQQVSITAAAGAVVADANFTFPIAYTTNNCTIQATRIDNTTGSVEARIFNGSATGGQLHITAGSWGKLAGGTYRFFVFSIGE